MFKKLLLLFAALFTLTYTVNAQSWEIGATVGGSGYLGDFNPNNPLKFTDPLYSAFVKRNMGTYFSVKLGVYHGTISGSDASSSNAQMQQRNLSFFTNLDELSLTGELNLFSYMPLIGKNTYTPYIFAGIGTTSYTPMATYKNQDYDLRTLMTEGQAKPYKESAIAIPIGAGIKYNFTGQWNMILDLGYRITNTGYLDDVYGAYADKSTLSSDIARALSDRSGETTANYTGAAGSQRGNSRHDTYMFLGFTISYTFLSNKCYSFN
jgi:hypothetical protein